MYIVEKYKEDYKVQLLEFIIQILVVEFGYEEFREPLKNEKFCDNQDKFNWIALDENNNIIGTITLEKKDKEEAFLKKFYVKKEYRGTGVAKELFNSFLSFAKDNSYKKIILGTYENLNRAISFYIKNGFQEYVKETKNNKERHFFLNLSI